MDLAVIEDIFTSIKEIKKIVNENKLKSPGTMNVVEIMNRHHLENQHSNIIAFLIDPNEKHNHEEYGKEFLNILKTNGLDIKGNQIISVKREDYTDEARRIDIFIKTDIDYIIIENKINARDQFQQIKDYIKSTENYIEDENNIFVVYLTPFGKDPTEISISNTDLLFLKNQKRFINLSYAKDILTWLNKLQVKKDEETLKSGLLQYIDVVKAITNQREVSFNMSQEISKELVKRYGNLNREQLKDKMKSIYDFQKNINLVLFLNFFEDIHKESKGLIKLFCNNKDDYSTIDEWKNDVIDQQEYFGVRHFDKDNNITKDFFVQDMKTNKMIFACKEQDIENYGLPVSIEGYKSAADPNHPYAWIFNTIIAKDNWEEKQGKKLATHIVTNFFNLIH